MPGGNVMVTQQLCLVVNCMALGRAYLYCCIKMWRAAMRMCRGQARRRLEFYVLDLVCQYRSEVASMWQA